MTVTPLTAGVRRLVPFLRTWGFQTTDSGDGVENIAAGMEGALDYPHVAIVISPDAMVACADRLRRVLAEHGIVAGPIGTTPVEIQALYDPGDRSAVIMLVGACDAMLPEEVP